MIHTCVYIAVNRGGRVVIIAKRRWVLIWKQCRFRGMIVLSMYFFIDWGRFWHTDECLFSHSLFSVCYGIV